MELAEAAQQMFSEGQRRWPRVTLDFATFQSHCQRMLQPQNIGESEALFGADLYLCCACARGDREALREFQRECSGVARAAIERIRRDPEFLQEVLQELWEKLLVGPRARVLEYSGRGPLQAWVRVSAARAALDRCRSQKLAATRQSDLVEELASEALTPELSLKRARHANGFREALRSAVAALSKQERCVLRMHVIGRCSIDQIGRAYQVHRATAARWLERARDSIFEHACRQLSLQNSRMTESEFKSLARALGSELDLSLSDGAAAPVQPSGTRDRD